jgi:hypothetical protein
MVGEVVAVGVCLLLWGARAYLATKYVIRYRVAGERRWAWRRGTPDWITRAMPWLEFLSWIALLGFIAWWVLSPVHVMAVAPLARCFSPDAALRCHSFHSVACFRASGELDKLCKEES